MPSIPLSQVEPMMSPLRISEIFYSLQGETQTMGLPTVFIRLTGCPLRCVYCDTPYAFKGGELMSISSILSRVKTYQSKYVTVTGGEPLAQKPCLDLLTQLCDAGYSVSLETSGALDVRGVDQRVVKILDLKTPDSKECHRNVYENIALLQTQDQVKFVLCSREDYEWSKQVIAQHDLSKRCEVLLSPSYHDLPLKMLAEWVLEDKLPVRVQFQLHKLIWGDAPGH